MAAKKTLTIDIYTDVICPWCWLGKRRLEKALEALPEISAEIKYLPYELNPATPAEGIDRVKHLTAKYGAGISAMDARLAAMGREAGLDYHFEKAVRIPNTFKAHRVIWLAGREGVQAPVIEALHSAYFNQGKDIGDERVLIETAASAGLDESKTRKLLKGTGGEVEVRELEEKSYNLGISGVPFFVFDGKTALSGAHPVETFVSLLKQLTD